MAIAYESRRLAAELIFDLEDRYARDRGVRGRHPRPIGPLTFRATGRVVGGAMQALSPSLELEVGRSPTGYYLFFGTVLLPGKTRHAHALVPGTYRVVVESSFYQRLERQDIVVPESDTPYFFDLESGYAYPFPTESTLSGGRGPTLLRGSLHHPGGEGIAGALIRVAGVSNEYRTDETGQWVLVFPDSQPSGPVVAQMDLPDGSVINLPNVGVVQGREAGLAQAALRGWVTTTAGVGLAGATLRVGGHPGGATTASDGSWFYFFGMDQPATTVNVTAVLPDGRSLSASNVQVQPRATVVVPSFRFS